jgi:hypothetical protein
VVTTGERLNEQGCSGEYQNTKYARCAINIKKEKKRRLFLVNIKGK